MMLALRRVAAAALGFAVAAALSLALLSAPTAVARVARVASDRAAASTAVSRGLAYLRSHQTKAGGFRVSSTAEQPLMTPWCILAIAAAGQRPTAWTAGGRNPIQYLQSVDLERIATSMSGAAANAPAFYAKVILAYEAAGASVSIRRAGSKRIDLIARLLRYQDAGSGRFTREPGGGGTYAAVNTTTWAILALKSASAASPERAKAVTWLKTHAEANGGFSWSPGGQPDVDTTAAAVQALVAGGVSRNVSVVRAAIDYLRSRQYTNGGFFSGFSSSTNTESTAWSVQAIVAAGENPGGSTWRKGGKTPLDYLRNMQASSGAFYHLGTILASPLMTSSQAIIALSRRPFPF